MQWPANFDWKSTRAINRPVSTVETTHEKFDPDTSYDKKQNDVSATGGSVAGDSYHTSEDELDHVALHKAFKFAATSSVALVSFWSHLDFHISSLYYTPSSSSSSF